MGAMATPGLPGGLTLAKMPWPRTRRPPPAAMTPDLALPPAEARAEPGADALEARAVALDLAAQWGLAAAKAGWVAKVTGAVPDAPSLMVTGHDGALPVRYPLGIAAAGVLGAVGLALASLARLRGAPAQAVQVDVTHAAYGLVSFRQLRLDGQAVASPGDANPLVGIYRCRDGAWFALHGGFESLREATLRVLGAQADFESIASAVGRRDAVELEESFGAHGLCGVACRSAQDWQHFTPGRILGQEALVEIERIGQADVVALSPWNPGDGALTGVRVLDFTRILAGPTCGRLLAAAGADVLVPSTARLPNIPGYALETGSGKRFLELDLDEPAGHEQALRLADRCDVLVDSFRSGALARRGLGPQALAARRGARGVVFVSINCYGHTGPWVKRPGWELMGQAATGLAVGHGGAAHPKPLWTYPCDYLTGYLAAAGAACALARRAREGGSWHVKVSLARTGMYTQSFGLRDSLRPAPAEGAGPWCHSLHTPMGTLRYLPIPIKLPATPLRGWEPAVRLAPGAEPWPVA